MSMMSDIFPEPEALCSRCKLGLVKDEMGFWTSVSVPSRATCPRGGPHHPETFDWSQFENVLDKWTRDEL